MKKKGGSFNVTMGAYEKAKVSELIGIYMLYLIGKKYNSKNIGIWRWRVSHTQKCKWTNFTENTKKTITIFVSQKRLVIIECNLKVVNYLDVTFNLNYGSYQPYRKPNDETKYMDI